jgi:hypothetical protein
MKPQLLVRLDSIPPHPKDFLDIRICTLQLERTEFGVNIREYSLDMLGSIGVYTAIFEGKLIERGTQSQSFCQILQPLGLYRVVV